MNQEISIGDLALTIGKLMQADIDIKAEEQRVRPDGSEVTRLRCNNAKLLEHTGWQPSYTLHDGLLETITWIKSHAQLYKTDIYTV
jgi:dTDP-glucose 4,6-dehydratase